jgi:DNA-binding transcriptional ArsR family regulator
MLPDYDIAAIISPLRLKMLDMLRKEMHPEELGRKFGITRQAVDKHLSLLYKYGFVDKRIKEGARPMVFYRITPEGEEFLQNFEDLLQGHIVNIRKRYKEEIFSLDRMLVEDEIDEKEYKSRKRALDKRFQWVMEK